MKMTSAQAAKLLRQLDDEYRTLIRHEDNTRTFIAAISEDVESVRPEYSYTDTKKQLDEITAKIRKVKHAINIFNSTTIIPGFDMTIDEMLVYLPQLSARASRLSAMKDMLPKERVPGGYGGSSQIIDYRYANFDIAEAKEDYAALTDELAKAQTALDLVNSTAELDIEI